MRGLTLRRTAMVLALAGRRYVRPFSPHRGAAPSRRHPSGAFAHSSTPVAAAAANTTRYTIHCPPTDPDVLSQSVRKHVLTFQRYLDRRPVAAHTAAAFVEVHACLRAHAAAPASGGGGLASPALPPLILDSGCGTGRSSLVLGEMFPEAVVLGVDKSLARLEKNRRFVERDDGSRGDGDTRDETSPQSQTSLVCRAAANVYLVRAELVDFWRCARAANLRFARHYLLYPNPYPKAARLGSRWYAHPALPLLLQTAPHLVVRSNWRQYLTELVEAVRIADRVLTAEAGDGGAIGNDGTLVNYAHPFVLSSLLEPRQRSGSEPCWTNFEQKYHEAGEPTFELILRHGA